MTHSKIEKEKADLVEMLKIANHSTDALEYLYALHPSQPGLHLGDANLPPNFFGTFFSFKGTPESLRQEMTLYCFLNSLKLRSAPRMSENFTFSKKGGCVLLDVDGVPECGITQDIKAGENITPEAVEVLIADLEKLADAGWYHPWLVESTGHWYVHPVDGRIIVFAWHWEIIRPIESSEQSAIRRSIAELSLLAWS